MTTSFINYSLDVLDNITGPTDVFVRMNYAADGVVGLFILIAIFGISMFGMLRKGFEMDKSILGSSFIAFVCSLAMVSFGEFGGVSMIPIEYVVAILSVMVFSLVIVYWRNRQ